MNRRRGGGDSQEPNHDSKKGGGHNSAEEEERRGEERKRKDGVPIVEEWEWYCEDETVTEPARREKGERNPQATSPTHIDDTTMHRQRRRQ